MSSTPSSARRSERRRWSTSSALAGFIPAISVNPPPGRPDALQTGERAICFLRIVRSKRTKVIREECMREGGARVGREQCRCRVEKREEACIAVDFASFTFPPKKEDCFATSLHLQGQALSLSVGSSSKAQADPPRHVGRRESVHPEHHAQARGCT